MQKVQLKKLLGNQSNFIQASWLGIGNSIVSIISILLMVFISRFLIKSEYGSFRQIMYVYTTIISVIGLSLSKLPSNYLPLFSLEKGKDLINKLMTVLAFTALCFAAIVFVGAPLLCDFFNNPQLEAPLRIFSIVVFFTIPTLIIEGIYASYKRTQTYGMYLVFNKVLFFIMLSVPLFIGERSLNRMMSFWAIQAAFSFLLGIYLIYLPFLKVYSKKCGVSYFKIYNFLIPLTFSSIWAILFTSSDQYYISNYFGEEIYADFSNGSIKIPFIGVLIGSISAVLHPYFVKKLNDPDTKMEIAKTIKNSISKSVTLVYPIIIFIWFASDEIFSILFDEIYKNSSGFFKIISTYNLFSVFVFLPIIIALQEVRFYNRVHFGAVIVVWGLQWSALNFKMTPYIVPAISLLVKIGIIGLLLYKIVKRLKVSSSDIIPFRSILSLTFTCAFILIPIYLIKDHFTMMLWQNILFLIVCFVIYYSILLIVNKKFKNHLLVILKQFN
ncbi:MAG: oligosaccharide flippase family protein [Flavobacteriaceae bacterium]|nr:oligosaccharide flippase family protein [Flavobacteriaceae bacterium]